ncbi:PLP-dependent transferase [Zopfia rhizophila CBS 207.26]|uniref:PLP-dependent transferase n=1 Tax=Zopfia rhizophila CBS 207.26 TaxID=1314779 RepID=A0A6A6DXJ1_9PEZI|nr:PLP-dependent transferase [Zopfia rhizophila CBS 207.26]
MAGSFSTAAARDRFPALNQDQVFLDNAGGSQVLGDVIHSIYQYLSHSNVQLGASYNVARESTSRYDAGRKAAAQYVNASPEEVVLGASTTQLFHNLAVSLTFQPGDEIILSRIDHETGIDPWLFMAERQNLTVKWWVPEKGNLKLTPENLKPLLSPKTKFVACTHISNILGTIHDIRSIADTVHTVGALFSVDGVSFAPHRQVDMKEFGVDFYAFSWYKVYGPHISVLYAKKSAQEHMKPLGHYFNPTTTLEDKIGFAAANYELTQTIPLIVSYLGGSNPRPVFAAIAEHEGKLQKILLDYLTSRKDVTLHGETSSDPKVRVPTISFTVNGMGSRKVVEDAENISNYGFRWGHFYSKRLCDEVLGLGEEGVVRISIVHYNTEEEVRGLVEILKKVLP